MPPRPKFRPRDTELSKEPSDADKYSDDPADDEDEPLSVAASRKSSELYESFYRALVSFREHFISEHETAAARPASTDSEDSELSAETEECSSEAGPPGARDVEQFDDLSQRNMRRNRMDEETRAELSLARRKVDGKTLYACSICDRSLSSRYTYLFHKRIHTGERPCVCHLCGKQFRAPPGLRRHLAHTHERRRPRACPLCHRAFASAQNLKQHLRTHTGERPYACPACPKRFTQSGSLHVHLKSHAAAAPHRCPDCGKRFKLRSNMTRHRLNHSGERPHACVHCGKTFRQRHELNCHVLSHLETNPHSCQNCGAAFAQRRALRTHVRKQHPTDAADPRLYVRF